MLHMGHDSYRGTVVARWTAGQQVERFMIHDKIQLISQGCPRPSIDLQCRIMACKNIHSFESYH